MTPVLEIPVPHKCTEDENSFLGAIDGMVILAFNPLDKENGFIVIPL